MRPAEPIWPPEPTWPPGTGQAAGAAGRPSPTGPNPASASRTGLAARVRALLDEAARIYRGRPGGQTLAAVAAQLDGPLRVAIVGRVKAGKSTLLNALVGARVAATDAGECTRIVTWYEHAPAATAVAFSRFGPPSGLALESGERGWTLDLGGRRPEEVERVEVGLPSAHLVEMTLIDTPGLGSLTESAGRRTEEFLDGSGQVDAVLYLLRHLHASDVDFLDAFRDPASARTGPVHAVGVLSRADELGGGAPEALEHAAKAAAEYRSDPLLRGLVYTVLPIAGLLAEAATALTAADVSDLVALADAGPAATAPLVLSATRFSAPYNAVPVPAADRRRLLGTLGLFGVRLCLALIRDGVRSEQGLRTALHDHSGLAELRALLLTQFAERRDVLKADGALRALEHVARLDPFPGAHHLLQEVERIRGGAHELAELRLLGELRLGTIPAPPAQLATMERLLGGQGTTAAARLGLAPDSTPEDATTLLTRLHHDWTRVAQDRLTDPVLVRAARVLQRTCEGLVAEVRAGAPVASGAVPGVQQAQTAGGAAAMGSAATSGAAANGPVPASWVAPEAVASSAVPEASTPATWAAPETAASTSGTAANRPMPATWGAPEAASSTTMPEASTPATWEARETAASTSGAAAANGPVPATWEAPEAAASSTMPEASAPASGPASVWQPPEAYPTPGNQGRHPTGGSP